MTSLTVEQAMQLALRCHQEGKLAEADHLYHLILSQDAHHPEALHYRGVLAYQTGRAELAVELIQRAVSCRPVFPEAWSHLGMILGSLHRCHDSIAASERSIQQKPDNPDPYYNRGNVLAEKGETDLAISSFQQAVQHRPHWPEAQSNLITALIEGGFVDKAILAARHAAAILPNSPEVHCGLGNALRANRELDASIAAYHRALQLKPDWCEALNFLGVALKDKGLLDEAVAVYQRVLQLNPNHAEATSNLGVALQQKGHLDDAMGAYRNAIALDPDLADAHFNLGTQLLLRGDFAAGWREYEWRWKLNRSTQAWNNSLLRWDGSDLKGRTIVLHREQGFGDVFQFIRYVPMVVQRGGKVVVVGTPEMKRLLRSVPGIAHCAVAGEMLPHADVHCPLLSLPFVFQASLENIPCSVPYLRAELSDIQKWKVELNADPAKLKVGLVWAGRPTHENDGNRSMPLSLLAPLSAVAGVSFYSLQKGPAAEQVLNTPRGFVVIDRTNELNDFADTAGLIENLDLVISVDTAIVHLTGAMGKPVWTLLPQIPDWRWLMDREDSPWYPTMRLFRQDSAGDWEKVVQRVVHALEQTLDSKIH